MIANTYDYCYHRLTIIGNVTGVISFTQNNPISRLTLHLKKLKVVVDNILKISYLTSGLSQARNTTFLLVV